MKIKPINGPEREMTDLEEWIYLMGEKDKEIEALKAELKSSEDIGRAAIEVCKDLHKEIKILEDKIIDLKDDIYP